METRADGINYAFLNIMDGDKIRTTQYKNRPTTLYFQLFNGHYSYLMQQYGDGYRNAKDIVIEVDKSGGEYEVMLFPYFASVWQLSETPEWLTIEKDERYNSTEWGCLLTFTVEPNAIGSDAREADLEFSTRGARGNIIIRQPGMETGIDALAKTEIRIYPESEGFRAIYPASVSKVEIYNAVGQRVGGFALSGNESFIPADGLAKGVYLFAFPELNKTLKVVKSF